MIASEDVAAAREKGDSLGTSLLVALGIIEGAGKNDQHGREPGSEKLRQLEALEKQYEAATGREKTFIGNKIRNLRQDIARTRSGENHSQRSKRRH